MLPDLLTSSYLQYKADTNAVASWLATTAKSCGYAPDLLARENNGQQKASTGRLKGKARKQARETANQSSAEQKPSAPTYTIAVKDFINLAQHIAGFTKPPVSVPRGFATVLDRAIAVRRGHAADLSSQLDQSAKKKESDATHTYFLGVLEQVRDILRPRMPSDLLKDHLAKPPGTEIPTDSSESLSNQFKHLDIHEPSEAFINAPDNVPKTTTEGDTEVRYEAERLQDFDEAYFAFQLLLQDFSRFRNFIDETWVGYREGAWDLVAASITTNTAIDLARRLEDELQPLFAKQDGAAKMLERYYAVQCISRGGHPDHTERPGDDMNYQMYDIADHIFIPSYMFLKAFGALVGPRNIPQYKPGFYGTYDPSSDRSKMSAREKYLEDKIVLMEILPDFCVIGQVMKTVPAEDELTRGLREMFKTHNIPVWVAFAAQIFIDIHHVLREDVYRGFADLSRTANVINGSIKQNFEFHSSLRVETWPASNDKALRGLQARIVGWVDNDPIQSAKIKIKQPPGEPFMLMRRHPLFCGLWEYSLKALFHEMGIVFSGAFGSIMYAGHLYHAVRQEKLLNRPWADMELVMGMQQPESFFVGGFPNTPDDYLKKYALAMGVSASVFAKNKRKGPLEASKKGPKGLSQLAPVNFMFKDRYCDASGRIDLTAHDVENILAASDWEEENADGENKDTLVMTSDKADQKRWKAERRLSTTQLLRNLRNALQAESLEFTFNYFMMHRSCWRLLRAVDERCKGLLIKMYGPQYIDEENQLPSMVGYILMAAARTKKLGDKLFKKKSDLVTSVLLEKAAEAIDEMIGSGAGPFTSMMLQKEYGMGVEFEVETESGS